MFTLFCPILAELANAYDEWVECEHFRRQRLNARERYERDRVRGTIVHVPEDVQ